MTELITAQSDPRIIEAAAAKREQVRFWLKATGQDGVIISRRDNFAWLTCGGDNRVINNLKVYFVEKADGSSTFRDVNVNEYGAILDWPEGFFDQSSREAEDILRAAMRKRRAERKGGARDE